MRYSCRQIFNSVVLGMISHLGSLVLICLYLVGGGFLFILLELDNEKLSCHTSFALLSQKLNDTTMRGIAISRAGHNATMFYEQLYVMLFNFSKEVFTLGVSPTKNCSTLGQPSNLPSWNLANSIFFCATIVTTIGYGNITPQTLWGRVVCIIYGLIGIPLMLVFLGNFGGLMASGFRYMYLNLCCCQCFEKRQPPSHEPTSSNSICPSDSDQLEMIEYKSGTLHGPPPKMVIENVDIEEAYEDDRNEYINIPVTVVLCFATIYMLIGAAIFRNWETWDLVSAIYFSFITISTIGFGDLYPAKDVAGTTSGTGELIVAAIYCVIGLAMLSMCLSLIKDEIVGKFVWLGTKMGLINQMDYMSDECDNTNSYDEKPENCVTSNNQMKSSIFHNEAYENTNYSDDVSLNLKIKSA